MADRLTDWDAGKTVVTEDGDEESHRIREASVDEVTGDTVVISAEREQ